MASFVIHVTLYYTLIGITLFGALIIYKMLPRDRVVVRFTKMLAIFSVIYIFDSFNCIFGEYGYITAPVEMDYRNILIGAFSQLYFQYFLYSLIFSRQTTRKWIVIQSMPILVIVGATWIADCMGIFSQFESIDSELGSDNIFQNPLFIIRLTLILIQFLYAFIIAAFSFKLIPIYQDFIERTESNAKRNMIWIKEVCYLFLALSAVYTIDALFASLFTAILYFVVSITLFARVIVLMLNNYVGNLNLNDDLYSNIGVKWSIKRLWYVSNRARIKNRAKSSERELFNKVERWIIDSRAYANKNFSFKDVADHFPQLDYNSLDVMLQRYCGLTFQAYVRDIRIECAIKLMESGDSDLQLKYIANEVGFENGSSFSRAFKASKGVTASQWRSNGSK